MLQRLCHGSTWTHWADLQSQGIRCARHLHDVDDDCAAGGNEHDVSIDVIVVIDDPRSGQVQQNPSDNPDGEDGSQCPQDF